MIPSFSKLFHLGDRHTQLIYDGVVEVTEKIDGSQFSFGKVDGIVRMRSKGAEIFHEDENKMFALAKAFVRRVDWLLGEGEVYHGEFLSQPKHNTLAYDQVPNSNFCLFGIRYADGALEDRYEMLQDTAEALACDVAPLIYHGPGEALRAEGALASLMDRVSYLGGPKIEGIVVKNYGQEVVVGGLVFPVFAKLVSEAFKEKHSTSWGAANQSPLEKIGQMLNSKARWVKAVQYLGEQEKLEHSPRDIGLILKRINQDIEEEEVDAIKDELYGTFRKDILRLAVRGFPDWYKGMLSADA